MIKLCERALVFLLELFFENFLRQGIFTQKLKKVNVIPVLKKSEKNSKENYRPISLLLIYGKILEKLKFDTHNQHLESNSLLNTIPSGFRPGDSTFDQLLSILNSISQAFDCNPPLDVRSVSLLMNTFINRGFPLQLGNSELC